MGKFKGRNKFACVIDTDVSPNSLIDLWISGKDRVLYTGYPESVGCLPNDSPGGDYACHTQLEYD